MSASIAIQVLPKVETDAEVVRIVDEVIAYIQSTGLTYQVGAFETTIEGESYDELMDIAKELSKPGRDPRDELPKPILRKDVLEMKDLIPGMELTGTVRNVIDFGVFVDIGVHQDGLVHVSELSDRFISDPSEVVKTGDKIKVRVLAVDAARKRISLSARAPRAGGGANGPRPSGRGGDGSAGRSAGRTSRRDQPRNSGFVCNPFANL